MKPRHAIAALMVLSLLSIAPLAAPRATGEAGASGPLSVGKPVMVGHWSAEMCKPNALVPMLAMADRRWFRVEEKSHAVLTLTAPEPMSIGGPAAASMSIVLQKVKEEDALEGVMVKDVEGVDVRLQASTTAQPSTDPSGWPGLAKATAILKPGIYRTLAWHGYCSGQFSLNLTKLSPIKVKSVQASKSAIKLKARQKKTISVTVAPAEAADSKLTWTSSNRKVARVTSKGVVEGRAPGTAVIKIAGPTGKAAKVRVTVKAPKR
ncbi:MAG: Ig-like domain-containing protein [Micrococcales bacterium]|nr:Ig-like domain-containing protein [Micrococcales bacterium]